MSESGEPHTPREETQQRVERTVQDAWLAVTALLKMYADPVAREFIDQHYGDIASLYIKASLIVGALEGDRKGGKHAIAS
jgi:hypothetical protein